MKQAINDNPERKIKITSKYFPRVWKDVIFPEIRLAGKWLQDAGFVCGQFVTITQQGNSITITAVPEIRAQPAVVKPFKKKNSCIPSQIKPSEKKKRSRKEGKIIDMDIRPSQVAESDTER